MGECRLATFVRESATEGRPAMLEVRAVRKIRTVRKCGSVCPKVGAGYARMIQRANSAAQTADSSAHTTNVTDTSTTETSYVRNAVHPAHVHAADVGRTESANSWAPNMHTAAKWRATDVHAAAADVHATAADMHSAATTADMHATAAAEVPTTSTAADVRATSTTATSAPTRKRRGWSCQQDGRS